MVVVVVVVVGTIIVWVRQEQKDRANINTSQIILSV
jgi:hypothetical protein